MKQGRASSSGPGSRKREPIAHAINPGGVAQFGLAQGNHTMEGTTNYRGDRVRLGAGYTPPKDEGRQVHRGGSQGKHR